MGFFVVCWFSNLPFKTLRTLREPIDSLPKPSLLHLYAAITTSHGTYRETPQEELECSSVIAKFVRLRDFGWAERRGVVDIANVQVLPVSIFSSQ